MSSGSLVVEKTCQSVQIDGKVTKLDGVRPLRFSGSPPGQGARKRKSWENKKFRIFLKLCLLIPWVCGATQGIRTGRETLSGGLSLPLRDLQLPVVGSYAAYAHTHTVTPF